MNLTDAIPMKGEMGEATKGRRKRRGCSRQRQPTEGSTGAVVERVEA